MTYASLNITGGSGAFLGACICEGLTFGTGAMGNCFLAKLTAACDVGMVETGGIDGDRSEIEEAVLERERCRVSSNPLETVDVIVPWLPFRFILAGAAASPFCRRWICCLRFNPCRRLMMISLIRGKKRSRLAIEASSPKALSRIFRKS